MNESTINPDIAEQQKTASAFFGSVLNSGADPVLKAQADILISVENTVTGWLRRRQEAVVEAQNLIARLSTGGDPSELLKVQQEWAAGAFRRLTADAAAYQTATQQLAERARTWFPQGAEIAETFASQAAAATRAAARPLRAAGKAGE